MAHLAAESGTVITDLDPLKPTFNHQLRDIDNHARGIKSTIKTQFPGINGNGFNTPILTTEVELNYLIGLTESIQASLDDLKNGSVPIGAIVKFVGNIIDIKSNYSLCDGTNGTPNLVNRFVYATVNELNLNDVGGLADTINMAHNHTFNHNHTGSTDLEGDHFHTAIINESSGGATNTKGLRSTNTSASIPTNMTGSHNHTMTINDTAATMQNVGAVLNLNIPPYVTLAYIRRMT